MDRDDQYRMVEDELLAIAQKFTAHLHAAEYKKRERDVQWRRAAAINSISRPMTGPKPDSTKRKLERVAQEKTQRTVLQTVLGEKKREDGSGSESDSEVEDLPYVGTTLHGLMDSPRKKTRSLGRVMVGAATRASAGFRAPAGKGTLSFQGDESPKGKVQMKVEIKMEPKDDGMFYLITWIRSLTGIDRIDCRRR